MAPDSSDYLHDDFNVFDNCFNYSSDLGALMDDGVRSAESVFSDNAESSLGSASVPWSTPAEDIFTLPRDHYQVQDFPGHFDREDKSEAMPGLPHNLGSCFHAPSNCDILGDDLLSNIDWEVSAQLNYTFDQAWPSSSDHSNNLSGFLDTTYGYDRNMPNEISTQVPSTANESQTPVYSPSLKTTFQRQVSSPLTEDHTVPRYMATYSSMATRRMSEIRHANMSAQEDNSRHPEILDTCLSPLVELPLNFAPYPRLLIMNVDLCVNHVNTTLADIIPTPSHTVTTSCSENSRPGTSQLVRTPQSSFGSSKKSDENFVNSLLTYPIHSKHRKRQPILPAPMKPYLDVSQLSQGSAHVALPPVYGLQRPLPRRSDRRKFTDKEKKKMREVRKRGLCVPCMVKNSKCDTNEICDGCQKTALSKNNKLIVHHICIRDGLLIFRQNILDSYDTESRLKMLPKKLRVPWRKIMIGYRVTIGGTESAFFPRKVQLMVRTREYKACDLDNNLVWSGRASRSAAAPYAIDPDTFPTASQLDTWGRNCLLEYFYLPGSQPYIMDKFLLSYLNAMPPLRHHLFVNLTVCLVSLSTWLLEAHPMMYVTNVDNPRQQLLFDIQDSRVESRLSQVARSQLMLIAAKGFEATEKELFSKLDALMRPMGCDPQSALIVGLCLRRISLLYRVSFKRYKQFLTDFIKANVDRRREKSKAMYEALTTGYSLVYRGAKSPYSKKWKMEGCGDALENDNELSNLFLEVVKYDRQYCEENRDDEDDLHLTTLFIDRKEGGGPGTLK
ncbi:hypothetical protein N431DRAFT_514601 [Stipitochalara longipes BDJ]|nr:hypothetical protein N431DRAFT_514601 [Stipitochalara longipes BDJ]